jgi:hypothetical protein
MSAATSATRLATAHPGKAGTTPVFGEERAARCAWQAPGVGRDPDGQVLGLKARQRHRQHEQGDAEPPADTKETVDEHVGGANDERHSGD